MSLAYFKCGQPELLWDFARVYASGSCKMVVLMLEERLEHKMMLEDHGGATSGGAYVCRWYIRSEGGVGASSRTISGTYRGTPSMVEVKKVVAQT